jgi:hypothetical protein
MDDLLIKVPESAHRGLLDSEAVIAQIREHLKPWCKVIQDLTYYGTNLIPRCFISSNRDLKDAVVLAILLRQVVAMLDGVDILLSNGACHTAQLPSRALFEASAYIDWILLADSEKKSLYYYVHNLRRMRLWSRRTVAGLPESNDFLAAIKKSGMQLSDHIKAIGKQQLTQIEEVLSQPKLAEVNADFDNHRKKRNHDPSWYVPLGPQNLRAIARAVDKLGQYTLLYSQASEVMHTSSYDGHIAIGKGEITFQPIRSLEGFRTVFQASVADAIATYRRVLQEYRPEELPGFSKKYLEKWQKDFMSFPQIDFKVAAIRI